MYDARGASNEGSGNLLFATVTIVVVGLAFLGAWFGGGVFAGKSSNPIAQSTAIEDSALSAQMSSPEEQRFLYALNALDSDAYTRLERDYMSAGTRDARLKTVGDAATRAVMANIQHLAHISAQDINQMLSLALREVGEARHANHELCRGSSYAGLKSMSRRQVANWMGSHALDPEAAYTNSVIWQADLLEMIARAKRAPQRHGQLTAQDQQAFRGLALSLMSDPVIMQLAMSNGDPAALGDADVCAMAETLLREVRGLPDDTKARGWASLLETPEFQRGLGQIRQMGY